MIVTLRPVVAQSEVMIIALHEEVRAHDAQAAHQETQEQHKVAGALQHRHLLPVDLPDAEVELWQVRADGLLSDVHVRYGPSDHLMHSDDGDRDQVHNYP